MDSLTLAPTAHLLTLGVTFHTHGGRARAADARLAAFHALMDGGALVGGADSDGLVEVRLISVSLLTFADFTTDPPSGTRFHFLQTTHPYVLFLLTFLVSAVVKQDRNVATRKSDAFDLIRHINGL